MLGKRGAIVLCCLVMMLSQIPLAFQGRGEDVLTGGSSASLSSYFEEHLPISIESNSDLMNYASNGSGIQSDPFIIERLSITATGFQNAAISIRYTTAYFVVKDCFIESEYLGIQCWGIAAGTGLILNNTCISTSWEGGGIAAVELLNCTIEQNRCRGFGQGIHLNHADRCTITGNNISDSTYQGINIRYSSNNVIAYNRIENSSQHGLVFVGTSRFNTVYQNIFADNGQVDTYTIDGERSGNLTSQGYDEGSNNLWYHEEQEMGNWWSDYPGSGSYLIDGPANAVDLYPIHGEKSDNLDFIPIVVMVALVSVTVVSGGLVVYRYRRRN